MQSANCMEIYNITLAPVRLYVNVQCSMASVLLYGKYNVQWPRFFCRVMYNIQWLFFFVGKCTLINAPDELYGTYTYKSPDELYGNHNVYAGT